jgi:enamine deaminase RidA (YjgF/YER057c/UK114 family)
MSDRQTLRTIPPPDGWRRPAGYANAIEARGRQIFVAGQIGWDPRSEQFTSDDLVEQTRQALANVVAVLAAAGAEPRHLTRLNWYVTDREAYVAGRGAIGDAYREVVGRHFPAMTLVVVAALLEPRARVEIEATAVVPE